MLRNINQPLPGTLDANGPRPYPTFGGNMQWREMTGEGNYSGLDLGFETPIQEWLQLSRVVHARQRPR